MIASVPQIVLELIEASGTTYPFNNITWLLLDQQMVYDVSNGTEV